MGQIAIEVTVIYSDLTFGFQKKGGQQFVNPAQLGASLPGVGED
jgi:hypothetical protein